MDQIDQSNQIAQIKQMDQSKTRKNRRTQERTQERTQASYRPTLNRNLVSLKSLKREPLNSCNTVKAFKLKEILQIALPNKKCVDYNTPQAIKTLLNRLRANKHIITEKIIPPKQIDGNCWFNTMFMMFFVSDKGRRFFHFFRQFMIEGKDSLGKPIPKKLRDAFALLNYGVELSLKGSKYAVNMDTNSIIIDIYDNIPKKIKYNKLTHEQNIPDWWDAGNPIQYYTTIMQYLDVNAVSLVECDLKNDWLTTLSAKIQPMPKPPHIIVLNGYQNSGIVNKTVEFAVETSVGTIKYGLDSASVLNDKNEHFSCVLTCEGEEMAFDGMSFSRIIPLKWKQNLNKNVNWGFKGSEDEGVALQWNFQTCYHQLIYYRL
jgi:hypothetical protein